MFHLIAKNVSYNISAIIVTCVRLCIIIFI